MSRLLFSLPLVEGGGRPLSAPTPPTGTPDDPDRWLLRRGNAKLGDDICHFDLPAVTTCPGRSRGCSGVIRTGPRSKGSRRCYVLSLYRRRPSLLVAHGRNLDALQDLPRFVRRVLREVRQRRVRTIRWHVGGDVHTAGYARALLLVMSRTPEVEHFLYSRSWRVPHLRPWLERMADLPNVAVWFSCDQTTGLPPGDRHPRVRLAWMALHAAEAEPWACAEQIAECDLVFMDTTLRHLRLSTFAGTDVCPQENDPGVTCTTCRRCLPQQP